MTADNRLDRRVLSAQEIKATFYEEHNAAKGCTITIQGTVVNSAVVDPATSDLLPDFSAKQLFCETHQVKSAPFIE